MWHILIGLSWSIGMNELVVGQLIDGKYEIQALLGSGAFGAVYRAYHEELRRVVAIKVLGARGDLTEDMRSRFSREARLLSALDHPNVISVYSYGLLENSIPFIVMEFLDGRTLAERLQDDEPLPQNLLLEIFMQVCKGVAAAHEAGIIHRDLKPENIFLAHSEGSGPGFVTKILDFGLSRHSADGMSTSQRLTQTGALLGSVQYMSPEAAAGQAVDQRSDIYSIACILYQCVAGVVPYDAETPIGILYKQQNEKLPPIPRNRLEQAPKGIELVIEKALEKDPSLRFQTAAEFVDALKAVKAQDMQLLSSLCDRELGSSKVRNKSIVIAIIAAAAAGLIGFLVMMHFQYQNELSRKSKATIPGTSKRNAKIRSGDLLTLSSRFSKAHSDRFNLEIEDKDAELRAIERDLEEIQPHLRIKAKLVDCLILRSRCFRDLDDMPSAERVLEQALKESILPSGKPATEAIGIRTSLAEIKQALGKAAEAEKLARENLPEIEKVEASYQKEEETLELKSNAAVEIGLAAALSRGLLANFELGRKNYQKALEYADRSAYFMEGRGILDGANSMRFLMGNCYLAMKQPEKAVQVVETFASKLDSFDEFKRDYYSGKADKSEILNQVHVIESVYYWYSSNGFTKYAQKYAKFAKDLRTLVGAPIPR